MRLEHDLGKGMADTLLPITILSRMKENTNADNCRACVTVGRVGSPALVQNCYCIRP